MTQPERPRCQLCGEPMPPGEEMFFYHGHSGPCPKPPLPRPKVEAVIEYVHDQRGNTFSLKVICGGQVWDELFFDSAEERQRAHDDLLRMMRSVGAKEPNRG